MTITKGTASIIGIAMMFVFAYSGYQYHEATTREEEILRLTRERDRLQGELQQSEQRIARYDQRTAQAEQRVAELQKKVDAILAAKAVSVAKSNPAPIAENRTPDQERMAQMKPLLEDGTPIKGAVIVLVDGKPVQRQVGFVMGKETRIEASDDGVYIVTPTLRLDGAVKYAIRLERTVDGESKQIEELTTVVTAPWKGFTLKGRGNGRVMAFDPDDTKP